MSLLRLSLSKLVGRKRFSVDGGINDKFSISICLSLMANS